MEITARLLGLRASGRYQFSEHALESMDDDGLTLDDLLCAVGTGRLRRARRRERKCEIEGRAIDVRPIRVVGRLLPGDTLHIITVYEVQ
jgi:hypothetical protein